MKTTQKAPIPRWSVRLATLAALAAAPVLGWAQNAIQSLSSGVKDGGEVIRLELSEPLAALPAGFVLQSPARVALDLPGVINATGRSQQEVNQGNLRSVALAQAGDRTRLVLNLKQSTRYRAEIDGKALVVTLEPVQVSSGTPATAAAAGVRTSAEPLHFADSRNTAPESLRDIDFRRGRDGAGRVVVDLPSNQVGVDIRQQGQNLIVEFLRSTAPEGLRRRLDVTDFGTPVQSVSTTQVGDRVRMTIEPRGNWEHSAYQSDNQFVLEVRPVKVDPQKLTAGPGFSGDKLSLNFQSIEVRALLQVIADFTNFNIVTSDTVTGNVTLRLKDVPWDQALDIIMQAKGLGVKKTGNVLWVAPKEELAAKEKAELEARAQVAALEPLRTQAFQLNYTKAEEISRALTGQQTGSGGASGASAGASTSATRLLSARGSVLYEARTNQLFVTDIPAKLEEVAQMVSRIDIPVRQVMIEARIVEAEDTFGRSLGIKLGSSDMRGIRGGVPGWNAGVGNLAIGGNYNAIGYQTNQSEQVDFSNTQFVNLPANTSSFGGASAASFALSLFGAASNRFLNLELSALEAEGRGKLVSSPRVITADQVKALIEQGTELPYQSATSSGATAIQFRKANLKLEVTPQITPEGSVILDVDVNKDSVGQSTSAGFAINTKHVKTQVLVENGGTVVIGGIFQIDETESVNKVPVLGDIPYVGALFRNKTRSSNKTELLVFLTPKVITDRNAPAR
ncbi:type IV pilus assembly protein PilQ [Sphaerotilus sulfidivorans]|uniref:Type IV pilus biogenesis and competence protein PilQ n=1 Tax=Sphaerotilus sulfidivorans TaxID=639200 RepID=A0A5C1Q2G9_9BURK|nr:type IV pilus secretin PilQ [Sphaerotilus sulfidivorans]NZD45890.1 type IV pilus secretin PilQ [Sphaerotilus sulfidivorans]QEN01741.1 type IV pilus secretin PilQ [Sphaerotilus sulfidivorans]